MNKTETVRDVRLLTPDPIARQETECRYITIWGTFGPQRNPGAEVKR